MNKVIIELQEYNGHCCVSIENVILLSLHSLLGYSTNIQLVFVQSPSNNVNNLVLKSKFSTLNKTRLRRDNVTHSLRPPLFVNGNIFTSGLCAVARKLIIQNKNTSWQKLLGFKNSCLQAPTEASCWTKFCEIDMINTVNTILSQNFNECETFQIPKTFSQFEAHLQQPIRMHNIFKVARQEKLEYSESLKDSINVSTRFAEGVYLTLADIMLYVCFFIAFQNLPNASDLYIHFPLITKWMEQVTTSCPLLSEFLGQFDKMCLNKQNSKKSILYSIESTEQHSLYKSDPKRYKPKNRIYTTQADITENLEKFSTLNIEVNSRAEVVTKKYFEWSNISDQGHLECGEIPEDRLNRKKNQIKYMVDVIYSMAKEGDTIVDFCSGTGHLGLTLACLLPKCKIVFLENKPFSIDKAKARTKALNLNNCVFYQSNIDYFSGNFDIGTSLHACGTATDIVLMKCILNKSSFVCCPCCYGSISPMPHINYPRSTNYKAALTEKEYLYIAHAADQTHMPNENNFNECKNAQGFYCMDVIDTDRLSLALEYGYKVFLTTLKPENCTLKNRLLIGSLDFENNVVLLNRN